VLLNPWTALGPTLKTDLKSFSPIDSSVRNLKSFVKYWLPVLLWMALIFSASSDANSYKHSSHILEPALRWFFPHLEQTRIDAIHYIFRKCGHLTEYAALALLLWRAIHNTRKKKSLGLTETPPRQNVQSSWKWDEAGLTILIVSLYAAIDEFHQIFVPDRTPLLSDIFIDTWGGAAAMLTLWLFGHWRKLW
jgi:VanZ family protein